MINLLKRINYNLIVKHFSIKSFYNSNSDVVYDHNKTTKEDKFEGKFIKKAERMRWYANKDKEDFKKDLFFKKEEPKEEQTVEYDELYDGKLPDPKVFDKVNGKDMYYFYKKPTSYKENLL